MVSSKKMREEEEEEEEEGILLLFCVKCQLRRLVTMALGWGVNSSCPNDSAFFYICDGPGPAQ